MSVCLENERESERRSERDCAGVCEWGANVRSLSLSLSATNDEGVRSTNILF
jgi:hypothetical protein